VPTRPAAVPEGTAHAVRAGSAIRIPAEAEGARLIRILVIGLLAILIALVWTRVLTTSFASLNDHYPADASGVIHVPAITALASRIAGYPFRVDCVPDPHDGNDARTVIEEWSDDAGETWHVTPPESTQINGQVCGALMHLLDYKPGFFHRYEIVIVSVDPVPILRPPRPRGGHATVARRGIDLWGDNRVEKAAGALLDVAHESEHAYEAATGWPWVVEGATECAAMRRLPEIIGSLGLPDWLSVEVLDAAKWRHADSGAIYLTVC
jgi:hypothetical protein